MEPARDGTRRRGGAGGLRTTLALGAGAIALFAAGAVAVIWAMGDGDAPAGPAPEPAAVEPVRPAAIAAAPPSPVSPALPAPAAPAAAIPAPPQTPEELDPSWGEVPVVFRTRDGLGPVGGYVFAGLRRAQEEMKHCYAKGAGPEGAAPASPAAADSPALLVLYLLSREGAIDVVEATIEDPGSVTPEVVECCRAVLRGQEFRAPNAQPGRRYRLKYAL